MSSVFALTKPAGVRLILVTGASRSGKTRYTEQLVAADRSLQIVHQDMHYHDAHSLPLLKFPCCAKNTRNWDTEAAVDWYMLLQHVADAMKLATALRSATVVVEGTELLACRELCAAADLIVLLSCRKWTCFERRIDAGRRQHYLPYLDLMWQHHCQQIQARAREHIEKLCIVEHDAEPGPLAALSANGAERLAEFLADLEMDSCSHHTGFNYLHYFTRALGTDDAVRTVAAAFVGHALGDAGGAPFEFPRGRTPRLERFELIGLVHVGRAGVRGAAPGAVTDDHMMLLQLARTIVANVNHYDKKRAIMAYIQWAQAKPAGMGRNTRALFQNTVSKKPETQMARYREAFAAAHRVGVAAAATNIGNDDNEAGDEDGDEDTFGGSAQQRSISNGSLMRCAGILLHRGTRAEVQQAAVDDASVSNDWLENRAANRLYAGMLWDLVFGGRSLADVRQWATGTYLRENAYSNTPGDTEIVADVAMSALHSSDERTSLEGPERGSVLTTLWAALRCARDFKPVHGEQVGEALRVLYNLGGDTDTNGAVAGALLGASVGWTYLVSQQSANVETVLNVPYRFCTMKNVLELEPRTIADLLKNWTDNNASDDNNTVNGKRLAGPFVQAAKAQRTK